MLLLFVILSTIFIGIVLIIYVSTNEIIPIKPLNNYLNKLESKGWNIELALKLLALTFSAIMVITIVIDAILKH